MSTTTTTTSTKYAIRRARHGTEYRHTLDQQTYAQLLWLQEALTSLTGQQESLSTIVRRAIAAHTRTVGGIVKGLRTSKTQAKARDALDCERYYLNVAALGSAVPFEAKLGGLPENAGALTFDELLDQAEPHTRARSRKAAATVLERMRKEGGKL